MGVEVNASGRGALASSHCHPRKVGNHLMKSFPGQMLLSWLGDNKDNIYSKKKKSIIEIRW